MRKHSCCRWWKASAVSEEIGSMRFTPELAKEFRQRYAQAKQAGDEQFEFYGWVTLTVYAKYMVEYLTNIGMLQDNQTGGVNE